MRQAYIPSPLQRAINITAAYWGAETSPCLLHLLLPASKRFANQEQPNIHWSITPKYDPKKFLSNFVDSIYLCAFFFILNNLNFFVLKKKLSKNCFLFWVGGWNRLQAFPFQWAKITLFLMRKILNPLILPPQTHVFLHFQNSSPRRPEWTIQRGQFRPTWPYIFTPMPRYYFRFRAIFWAAINVTAANLNITVGHGVAEWRATNF